MRIRRTQIRDKFLRYVSFDTQSDPTSDTTPSTRKQWLFAEQLADELNAMGAADVSLDENGYVTATIPANSKENVPVIGLIAHMDTSPDMSGADIQPQIVENYDGNDIVLNSDQQIVLRTAEFSELKQYNGQTIITTNGITLLGADDKAGIAAIMSAAEYLLTCHDIKHGTVRIGFTPDEEIGRGADHFNVKTFGADYAYTFDGGEIGELEYENFNAAEAAIIIKGNNIHPGYAKGKMINALNIALEFHAALPVAERPETTEGREGFFHLTTLNGSEEQTLLHYIIRDFEPTRFTQRKAQLESIADTINKKYKAPLIQVNLRNQYYNMYEKILPHFYIIEKAQKAMENAGVKVNITAARGGTDGARLSYMGLPCPNIFTGGHNPHGKYEFLVLESLQKTAEVILELVKI